MTINFQSKSKESVLQFVHRAMNMANLNGFTLKAVYEGVNLLIYPFDNRANICNYIQTEVLMNKVKALQK